MTISEVIERLTDIKQCLGDVEIKKARYICGDLTAEPLHSIDIFGRNKEPICVLIE